MLVKITKTHNRATDCRTVRHFKKNEVLELEEAIAEDIVLNDYGIESKEEKMLDVKIENKAFSSAPSNKEEDKSKNLKISKKLIKAI